MQDLHAALRQARKEKASTQRRGLTAEEKAQLQNVFNLFDADGGGSIDATELRTVMKALGFEVTKAEVLHMIAEIDADGNGTVDFSEFLSLIEGAATTSNPQEECRKAFVLFTGSETAQSITAAHIVRVAREAGEELTDAKVKAMLSVTGADDTDGVSLPQFINIMRRTGNLK